MREFLAQLAISDEVGVFLPPVGRASVALFLERCSGKFRKHELAKLRRIYPVLAGLFQAHVGTLFGGTAFASETGSALSAKRPVLVTDQSGQEIFANAAWQALMAMESESILKAMAWCQESNEAQTPIVNDRVLLLSSLNNTLRVAPGCIVWSVDKLDRPPTESIHKIAQQLFESTLTRREREIVALILRGYPTSIIAKKLVVKPGTVKNHRRNIYLKLDITTERELFLRYVDAIVQART